MAVFRVVKNSNYSVISNYYLRNSNLSLKAIGLFTIILSLKDDFNYSVDNISKLTNKSYKQIKSLLNELKENGYLVINKKKDDKGLYIYEYIWFESNSLNPQYTFHSLEKIDNKSNNTSYSGGPEVQNGTIEYSIIMLCIKMKRPKST